MLVVKLIASKERCESGKNYQNVRNSLLEILSKSFIYSAIRVENENKIILLLKEGKDEAIEHFEEFKEMLRPDEREIFERRKKEENSIKEILEKGLERCEIEDKTYNIYLTDEELENLKEHLGLFFKNDNILRMLYPKLKNTLRK